MANGIIGLVQLNQLKFTNWHTVQTLLHISREDNPIRFDIMGAGKRENATECKDKCEDKFAKRISGNTYIK